MWVLQYIQYPIPAGLKPVKQDQYLRTIWDKIPEAPPKGEKGLDKLTICYDPDEHGVYRKSKDFLTGLNLASGFCIGRAGVYVLQSPYLLFYADNNQDDIPDGDPEVLLTGFGFDDTHSVANSLQWGPDGWLYGAAGSTSTSKIANPAKPKEYVEFQQGIWRYHPQTKRFEMFSEGGGNTFGLDFDQHGQCITGTNWGGFAMLHQMQGAYYVKGFSKHGPLHNPYAYGYFDHVPYKNFQGGHVTCGGVMYEADIYPEQYRGQYIAGNLLSNCINWHKLKSKAASFSAEHGGTLLDAKDSWFRPVDLQLGPDGCVYVVDWYDRRAAHLDPVDDWDKTNGRIYRIEYQNCAKYPPYDLQKKSSVELLELLKHPNMWWRKESQRLLRDRKDWSEIEPILKKWVFDKDQPQLEALWLLGTRESSLDRDTTTSAIQSQNKHVREWIIRLLGDRQNVETNTWFHDSCLKLSQNEQSPHVLAQIACTAKRIGGKAGTDIVLALLTRKDLAGDTHLPMLIWWSFEPNIVQHWKSIYPVFLNSPDWTSGIAERAIRRWLAADQLPDANSAPAILTSSKCSHRDAIMHGMELALDAGSQQTKTILKLAQTYEATSNEHSNLKLRILAKSGDETAQKTILNTILAESTTDAERIRWIPVLSKLQSKSFRNAIPNLYTSTKSDAVRTALIASWEVMDGKDVPEELFKRYTTGSITIKRRIVQALLSRATWALQLFRAYDSGVFPKADLTLDHAKTAVALNDEQLTALLEKHFGKIAPETAGDKRARIAAINLNLSREKPGNPELGKAIFTKTCSACHQLFGEGNKVGPDLTTADRKSRSGLLTHIIDPSGYIRPEYISYTINTLDGRTLIGIIAEQSPDSVSLATYLNGKVERIQLMKVDIDSMKPSPLSLMPEKILDTYSMDDIRHFMAYIMLEKPMAEPKPAPLPKNKKYRVALVSGSGEYKSHESLPIWQKHLEANAPVECIRIFNKSDTELPGIEKLADCDAAVFFTRRLKIDGDAITAIKKFVESGKPILGIRTASHGFQNWLEMDQLIFGGDYKGHFGANVKCDVSFTDAGKKHSILQNVKPFASVGSLYKNAMPAKDVIVLQNGTAGKNTEPVTWMRERKIAEKNQRIFYTSLGHPEDFADEQFIKMLTQALGWCLKDEKAFAK